MVLRPGVQSVADLRISHRCVARMVSVSRNLVCRPVSLVRNRLRNRVVRRFWMGMAYCGSDWHNHVVLFNHVTYISRSRTFYNRRNFYRGGVARGGAFNRPGAAARPFNGSTRAARGYAEPRGQSGLRSGAFSGYGHGGEARSFSSRGRASFAGGGFHGGGGGGNRSFAVFIAVCKNLKWREVICRERKITPTNLIGPVFLH